MAYMDSTLKIILWYISRTSKRVLELSTNPKTPVFMVRLEGFEPSTNGLEVR